MRYLRWFLYVVILGFISISLVTMYFLYSLRAEKIEYLKNEVTSFEVVVARYNENLSWIEKELPNDKVTIYNKGEDELNLIKPNVIIKKLPNIGRESHTYLHHIIENYDNLAERILFLQGNPFSNLTYLFTPLSEYKKIKSTKCKNIIAKACFLISTDKQTYILKDLKNSNWKDTIYKKFDFNDFKQNLVDVDNSIDNYFFTNLEANFAVDKCKILARPKEYYQNILNELDNIAPIEGHYLERLWDVMFSLKAANCQLPN